MVLRIGVRGKNMVGVCGWQTLMSFKILHVYAVGMGL